MKDFRSPKELANYLLKLDGDDILYNSYFAWKAHYDIVTHSAMQCSLCEYLNISENITKTYENIGKFWGYNEQCYAPEIFHPNIIKSAWQEIV